LPSFLRALACAVATAIGLGAAPAGCSLTNVAHNGCTSNTECGTVFGAGSKCSDGYCSEAPTCTTGHDCRKALGGGACVAGHCVTTFPTDLACTLVEPKDLLSQPMTGAGAPLVIGSIFSLDAMHDHALTQAILMGVREINDNGGINNGQKLGVVFCDNGGTKDLTMGTARTALSDHALDYLAGTLGVPLILGPLTSGDSVDLVTQLVKKAYPTVILSPSATSTELTDLPDRLHTGDPYGLFWRTCPSDEHQGEVLANDVVSKNAAIKSVTVVYIRDAYGEGLATVFQNTFGVQKTHLVPYDTATPGDAAAVKTLATTADAFSADATMVISHHGSITIQVLEAMQGLSLATKPFFFTDGSMDTALLDSTLPVAVQSMLTGAQGTAPASLSGQNYTLFATNLLSEFQVDATSVSFLAQAYDAAYVGAYGLVYASKKGTDYDGLTVAEGLSKLSAGTSIDLGSIKWQAGKSALLTDGQIDIEGTSGHLQFDAAKGEAPGAILIWGISMDLKMFTQTNVVQ
jgi:ABC-type branched-subunit amino acid transport system substrate-binding protein